MCETIIEQSLPSHIQLSLLRLHQTNCADLDAMYAQVGSALQPLPHLSLMRRLEVDRRFWLLSSDEEAVQRGLLSQASPCHSSHSLCSRGEMSLHSCVQKAALFLKPISAYSSSLVLNSTQALLCGAARAAGVKLELDGMVKSFTKHQLHNL